MAPRAPLQAARCCGCVVAAGLVLQLLCIVSQLFPRCYWCGRRCATAIAPQLLTRCYGAAAATAITPKLLTRCYGAAAFRRRRRRHRRAKSEQIRQRRQNKNKVHRFRHSSLAVPYQSSVALRAKMLGARQASLVLNILAVVWGVVQ